MPLSFDRIDDGPTAEAALAGMDTRPVDAGVEVPDDIALDAGGRIDQDIDCRACGYNLRGGDPQGACPECGTAVGFSLVGDLLKFADPVWVRTLAAGSGWIIASVVATFLVLGLFIVGAVMSAASGPGPENAIFQFMLLGMILPLAIGLYGYWLVTSPEPVEGDRPRPLRAWARWLAVASALLGAGFLITLAMLLDDIDMAVIVVAGVIMLPLSIASTVTLMLWARFLAFRLPDRKLAEHTKLVMWGLVIHEVIDMFSELSTFTSCLSGVLGLVFGIWAIVLMVQYRNRLTRAAGAAERSWARQTARFQSETGARLIRRGADEISM